MSSSLAQFDGLGDWRLRGAATLASPVYYAGSGAPFHAAGSPVYLVTPVSIDEGKRELGFNTPSPIALCLSIAFGAAGRAFHLRSQIRPTSVSTPKGHSLHVNDDSILFDAFEQFLVCVQFSYSAIECHANELIGEKLKTPISRPDRDGKPKDYQPDEVERFSLPDKLANVLPELCAIDSPKGRVWWQDFKGLEDVRHDMVHWKSKHQYPGTATDADSPFYHCLNRDPWKYPRLARSIIAYWYGGKSEPRWLRLSTAF